MNISKLFYITTRSLLNFFGFGQGNCLYYPTCSEIIEDSIEKKMIDCFLASTFKKNLCLQPNLYEIW